MKVGPRVVSLTFQTRVDFRSWLAASSVYIFVKGKIFFWTKLTVILIYTDRTQMQMVTQFSVYYQMTIKNSLAGTLATVDVV